MKIKIQWTDGTHIKTTLSSFLKHNRDDQEMIEKVQKKSEAAKIGKKFFKDGGGAIPEFSLIRLD